jgi:hypothetical protein
MTPDQVRLLLTGPTCMTILLSFLAVTALLAWALGRLDRLASLGERSVERLGHGRALLLVWGLAALLLTILLAGVFFTTKILALLGLVALLLGLTLAGFGLGVSADRFGRKLAFLLSREPSPLLSLTLGLSVFFLASFLPFVGWTVVILALLAGGGATLDALLRRE